MARLRDTYYLLGQDFAGPTSTISRSDIAFANGKRQAMAQMLVLSEAGAARVLVRLRGAGKARKLLRRRIRERGGKAVGRKALCRILFSWTAAPAAQPTAHPSAYDAAGEIIRQCLPRLRAQEAGIVADLAPAHLHAYRVALRKIRAAVSLLDGVFSPAMTAHLKAGFAALMAATGPLRDLDVYLAERQAYHDLFPKSLHEGLDLTFQSLASARDVARQGLVQHLLSQSYQHEIAALSALFTTGDGLDPGPDAEVPAADFARDLLRKRYRKLRKSAAGISAESADDDVHALRIECKKLRYMMEFFATDLSADETLILKPLKRLQGHLGRFNDLSVQEAELQRLFRTARDWPEDTRRLVGRSIAGLSDAMEHQKGLCRTQIQTELAGFANPRLSGVFSRDCVK